MSTPTRLPLQASSSAIAMLVAASGIRRFAPKRWPHHRALWELRELCSGGVLGHDAVAWRFEPSADGGYALVGLDDVFLVLAEEGWLRREAEGGAAYVVTPELHERGAKRLQSLATSDRRLVAQVARRWSAWARTRSKNPV